MTRITRFIRLFFVLGLVIFSGCASKTDSVSTTPSSDQWVIYDGYDGSGSGKHIVFVTGDEEYRSEEAMPQMAKILAKRHGFKCTVLFAIDPKTGAIDPETLDKSQSSSLAIFRTEGLA
mgnify:CR=1 FL=1